MISTMYITILQLEQERIDPIKNFVNIKFFLNFKGETV
jgi:hypothetical protein